MTNLSRTMHTQLPMQFGRGIFILWSF